MVSKQIANRAGLWRLLPLLLAVGVGSAGAQAQQAFPVVFQGGVNLEEQKSFQEATFAGLYGLEADLANLKPFAAELTDADRDFLKAPCTSCGDDAQLVPAGVVKTPDRLYDFNALKEMDFSGGTKSFNGGVANLAHDGTIWWNTSFKSSEARGLRLHLKDVFLPEGTELVVYSLTGEAHGPYTQEDVTKSGSLWTLTVSDPEVFLEVRFPAVGAAPAFRLHELGVMVDVGAGDSAPSAGKATSCDYSQCYVEYGCSEASDFPNLEHISNSVARILFQKDAGFYLCTGGLVNDGRGLENYLFVTANHCFESQASAESLEFRWKFRSLTCLGGCISAATAELTTGGADLIATSADTDFTMVSLVNAPPAGSVFLGWDATTNYADTAGIPLYRVHHPGGDMQHVTSYWTNTTNTSCTSRPRSRYIQGTRNVGFTAGGSSGSLLVNGQAQMVGQFYGGCGAAAVGSCDPNRIHVDGQFRVSYPLVSSVLTPVSETVNTYTFNVASGAWNAPNSWAPTRTTPAINDVLRFDGTSASGNTITVTSIPTETIGSLIIEGGASVLLEDGLEATTTVNLITEGDNSFLVGAGCTLELRNSSAGTLRIALQNGVKGAVSGDVIFAAQDDTANPRIVSKNTRGLLFNSGSTGAVAPGVGAATDSLSISRGGFGSATDGAVADGVAFLSGATWYQGGLKDGTRAGAQSAGPHGLSTPAQAVAFDAGSTYVVLRGAFASPRNYPTVIFRDDVGSRNVGSGSVINGDLILAEPGGNASGVGSLNINGTLEPSLTINGNLVIGAGASVPDLTSTIAPGSASRVHIRGNLTVADPAKFPAGLSGRRWTFSGTSAQTVNFGGDKTIHRLGIDNASGVELLNNVTLTGGLELTNGPVYTGANTLTLGSVVVSTPINGWVVGGVSRSLDPTDTATTRIFHIGTASSPGYARVTPTVSAGTAGALAVRSFDTVHPEAAPPGTTINRWWSITGESGLVTTGATFRMAFEWAAADIPVEILPADLSLARYKDGNLETWTGANVTIDEGLRRITVEGIDTPEGDWLLFAGTLSATQSWTMY